MSATIAPLSAQTAIVDADPQGQLTGFISQYFRRWLQAVTDQVQKAAAVLKVISLLAPGSVQTAAIVTTTAWATTSAGLYRVSYVLRVTQAASTSSSLAVTLGWLRAGAAVSQVFATLTSAAAQTIQSGSVLVRADTASAITYAVAYGSVGATPLGYEIDVVVELVQ